MRNSYQTIFLKIIVLSTTKSSFNNIFLEKHNLIYLKVYFFKILCPSLHTDADDNYGLKKSKQNIVNIKVFKHK